VTAFDRGREHFKIYKQGDNGRRIRSENYENPFDPGCTDYEDFFDGWAWERDKATPAN